MSRLRDRMQEDLKLAGRCENTQKTYLRCVARFSRHFGKSPKALGQPEVRAYLLELIERHKVSASTYNVYAAALCFLYRTTLNRPDAVAGIGRLKARRRLPAILTREEFGRLLEHLTLRMRTIAVLAFGSTRALTSDWIYLRQYLDVARRRSSACRPEPRRPGRCIGARGALGRNVLNDAGSTKESRLGAAQIHIRNQSPSADSFRTT